MVTIQKDLNDYIGQNVTVSFRDGTSASGKLYKKPFGGIFKLDPSYDNANLKGASFDFLENSVSDIE